MRAWIYNFSTFVYDVRSRDFECQAGESSRSTGALESSTSTGALEYEYERSSARVPIFE